MGVGGWGAAPPRRHRPPAASRTTRSSGGRGDSLQGERGRARGLPLGGCHPGRPPVPHQSPLLAEGRGVWPVGGKSSVTNDEENTGSLRTRLRSVQIRGTRAWAKK